MFNAKNEKHDSHINRLASCAFSVYIFHQTPAFYPILWKYVFRVESWIENPIFLYPIIVFVVIYGFVFLTEYLRKKYVEPVYLRNSVVKRVEGRLNAIYQKSLGGNY